MAESEEELKSLLMKGKEESEKAVLKLNIQKMKITVSGPITSWQIDGETMETVRNFIFFGSKITLDGDCRHEIKRHLLFFRVSTPLLLPWCWVIRNTNWMTVLTFYLICLGSTPYLFEAKFSSY